METVGNLLGAANKFIATGNIAEAIDLYQKALQIDSKNLAVLNMLATAYLAGNEFEKALAFSNRAIEIDTKSVIANANIGFIFDKQGKYAEAIKYFIIALESEPNNAFLWDELGYIFYKLNNFNETINCCKKAIEINRNFTEAYVHLGSAYVRQKNYRQAADYFIKAVLLDTKRIEIYYEISHLYFYEIADIEKAFYYIQKTLELNPDFERANMVLAEILLITENLSEGLPIYNKNSHVYLQENHPLMPFFNSIPLWRGEIFRNKNIVIGDHAPIGGFGDLIWLARYLPMVKERGGTVIFPVQKELRRLFTGLSGVDELIDYSTNICSRKFDLHIPLMNLPEIFQSTINTLPNNIPYLIPDPQLTAVWRNRLSPGNNLKVGLVWASSNRPNRDRTCAFKDLMPFSHVNSITYYSLQLGPESKEYLLPECQGFDVVDLTEHITDFADTAALIQNLDLVITVDTAVTHLAGAIGKPTWVMVPFKCDWKWFLNRSDSPWYPGMRVFRSKNAGRWDSVVDEITANLRELVNK